MLLKRKHVSIKNFLKCNTKDTLTVYKLVLNRVNICNAADKLKVNLHITKVDFYIDNE